MMHGKQNVKLYRLHDNRKSLIPSFKNWLRLNLFQKIKYLINRPITNVKRLKRTVSFLNVNTHCLLELKKKVHEVKR